MTTTDINPKTQAAAIALHARIAWLAGTGAAELSAALSAAAAVAPDRCVPRREQAAAARAIFKVLGLRGISVTAPNYSMASSVDVRLPKRADYTFDQFGMVVEGDPVRAANNAADKAISRILARAFPNHLDRSRSEEDYFDFCWSVG